MSQDTFFQSQRLGQGLILPYRWQEDMPEKPASAGASPADLVKYKKYYLDGNSAL
jgi:hypothetical protein